MAASTLHIYCVLNFLLNAILIIYCYSVVDVQHR
jgi:hypothetical protein